MLKIDIPAGRTPIQGPKPFRVEYPYSLPDDTFRMHAKPGLATCVAYHRGVDPRLLSGVERGNEYRYGPGDLRYEEIKASMLENGFLGGNAQRLIVHVDEERVWMAEGNHRLRIALETGVPTVEVEIRYLCRSDESFHLIPFEVDDPEIRVISD